MLARRILDRLGSLRVLNPSHLELVKAGQRRAWDEGDFSRFATLLVQASETLAEELDLRAGQLVLDIAAGSGNTALACARRNCRVVASDYVLSLLRRALARSLAERLEFTVIAADAERLPFREAAFDVVVSTFGVMFAPDQQRAAAELLRVCRPGGRIGLTTFPPDGFAAELFLTTARSAPPPRGVKPVVRWGMEEGLRSLFGADAHLRTDRRTLMIRFTSFAHWVAFLRDHFGPVRAIFDQLPSDRHGRLEAGLMEHIERFNVSGDRTVVAPVDYMQVIVER